MSHHYTATAAWHTTLMRLISPWTHAIAPRGMLTHEIMQETMEIDMRYPVVISPTRKLSDKFLGAEAAWILCGDDRVLTIALYNSRIADFSDDGQTFFGAYGPRWAQQLPYVVAKLIEDPDTRQAGLTFWRPSPPKSKDIPCTIAMFFNIRDNKLNSHVFMRSSDIWLGVPYDIFNFSMLACMVCCHLNQTAFKNTLSPGVLYLTAASRHIYDYDMEKARTVIDQDNAWVGCPPVPDELFTDSTALMITLTGIRHNNPSSLKWWTQ